MKMIQLKALVAVVEAGSFNQAAERLQVSKAAISQHISQLETKLGVQLIKRTTRRLSLTEAGVQLYQVAHKVLDDLGDVEANLSQYNTQPQGDLTVMTPPYFAHTFILPYLALFMQNYPKVKLTLLVAERFPDLKAEKIDVLIGVSMEGPLDLVRKKILSTRYIFAASPHYLEKRGVPMRPQDLNAHDYITHSMRLPDDEVTFKQHDPIQVVPLLRLNDTKAMLSCACQGFGIVKLHEYVATEKISAGELVEVLKPYSETSVPLYVYFSKDKFMPAKRRVFLDFLEKSIQWKTN